MCRTNSKVFDPGFIQIALQPVRCLRAVQDDLGVRKAGIAFRIHQSAAMVAVEVGEKNGLDRI
jgi:hypothetical protein